MPPETGQAFTHHAPMIVDDLAAGVHWLSRRRAEYTRDPGYSEPVIDAKTAKVLGLTIPPALLVGADRVIA